MKLKCIEANIKSAANTSCKYVSLTKCFLKNDHGIVGKAAGNSLFYLSPPNFDQN